MSSKWVPLSVKEGKTPLAAYCGPFDEVPEWLTGPLWGWVTERFPISDKYRFLPWAVGTYRNLASALRVSLEVPTNPQPTDARGMQARLHDLAISGYVSLLDIADYWLGVVSPREYKPETAIAELDRILSVAGSVFHVMPGDPPYLVRRVGEHEEQALTQLTENAGRPGEHLARAWQAVFGRDPRPGEGYGEAIKAVEAAAIPVVSPNNPKATLGTVITSMRARPGDWLVELHSPTPADQVPAVTAMLELLWKGQSDRHGTPDPAAPLEVTIAQAEAALHLGLTLVQWFAGGVVRRAAC